MISIIGNSPSTGSSFLADLLDSTPRSACGEELNLFSNKKLYNFTAFKKNIKLSSPASGIHRIRNKLNTQHLHLYGLTGAEFETMVSQSKDLNTFAEKFSQHFLTYREKSPEGILYEKTPENINCINEFMRAFPDAYFIHITRNPLYIYPSLLKRKFPQYVALLSWFIDVAKYIKYKNNEKVISVKYEDLVENPFKLVKELLGTTAAITDLSEQDIQKGYENNSYRKNYTPRLKTWSVTNYGTVRNANKKEIDSALLKDLATLLNTKISPAYAKIFDIAEISFIEAIKEFDYYDTVMEKLDAHKNKEIFPRKTLLDSSRLTYKWIEDFRRGDADFSQLNYYLNPVERVSTSLLTNE